MKAWKSFFAAAKGKPIALYVPALYGADDAVQLHADAVEVTDDFVIWTDEGNTRWLRLDAIVQANILPPEEE